MLIEYEPRFLDEAVRSAIGARPEGRLFHRERERVYGIADPEARGAAFDALNVAWCERLGVGSVVAATLAEEPLVVAGVERCVVGRPPTPADVGAELIVQTPMPDTVAPVVRVVRLLIRPAWLLEPATIMPLLRRELLHVADMLDPAFGYEPHLPAGAVGRTHERLLRDRYRAAWNATVDGRLVRAGRLDADAREQRWAEFAAVFGTLDEAAPAAFGTLFDDPAPTHARLVALALAPRTVVVGPDAGPVVCPLCGCPSAQGLRDGAMLPEPVQAEIGADFPAWAADDGCCRQCADLYEARPLSRAEAATFPGIR